MKRQPRRGLRSITAILRWNPSADHALPTIVLARLLPLHANCFVVPLSRDHERSYRAASTPV
jgi:hypothetical protein